MQPLLYGDLVPWYHLLDPPDDHADEAATYRAAFERVVGSRGVTLLDLGAGAGHNAFHLKQRFRCTLTDVSEAMLARSRTLNPECEHLRGDMRSLRLERQFDVVLVHDAVTYMTTRSELLAAATTAFVHTRPGGAAVFAPDVLRETFRETTEVFEGDDGNLGLRALAWTWDPDPSDETHVVDYAFFLRDGAEMKAVHDRHVEGLFSRGTWLDVLAAVGYEVEIVPRPLGDGASDEIFLCRRPDGGA